MSRHLTDIGGDNIYDVIVQASDGTLTDTQAIAVTVTDIPFVVLPPTADPPSESPPESGEEDAGESEDEITGNALNVGSNVLTVMDPVAINSSTGNDPNDSNQLNHLAKDHAALLQHLREGNALKGGCGRPHGVYSSSRLREQR